MTTYDNDFFKYVNSGAVRSAENLLPFLTKHMTVNSVMDVGCGQGAWLSVWEYLGATDVIGIDGDYVNANHLLIDNENFVSRDLSSGFNLSRHFDIVQSLEVAEHLPKTSAQGFVENLVRHGDFILFSAAPKGQGGDHHVNEQNYEYWRNLFSQQGYLAVDYLRPLILENNKIEPWYRYNTFLYVSSDKIDVLPVSIKDCIVEKDESLRDVSPLSYKLRKMVVRFLPVSLMTRLAKVKEKIITQRRSA